MKRFNFNLGCIVKGLALIAIILVLIFFYMTCSGGSCFCRPIDKTLPDVSRAPFTVTTETHFYYAIVAVKNADSSVTMTGWYEKAGDHWVYHEEKTDLLPVLHPEVKRR